MTDDRLLDRLAELDPATPDRIAAASGGADELRRRIEAEEVDVLAIHRRARRRRIATVIAAAAVTAALLVPLILLLPLGDDDTSTIGTTPTTTAPTPTATTEPTATSEPTRSPVDHGPPGPIEVTEPARGATVTSPVTISGTADVFEATVSIRILDATNNVLAETFTTATCGTGCRGDYTIDVPFSVNTPQQGVIQVFEVSAKDGSMINTVRIPVTLAPGSGDPVADAIEGVWRDANGNPVPDGLPATEPLVLHAFEGAEHCGWTSVTFMTMGWPPGTETTDSGPYREYYRDPAGLVSPSRDGSFAPNAALPADAASTGFHRHGWELWVAPSDSDEAVYVVNGDPATGAVVERWPRAVDPIFCD
jgi:Immunoglobulin-like domain of bacterial spore germination